MESNQNSILLPDIQKRTQCTFSIDQQAHQFLCNGCSSLTLTLKFRDYISTKRETKGVEATLNQCGQFFTFVVVGDRFSEAYCEVVGHRFRSKSSIRILIELTNSFAIQSVTKSFTPSLNNSLTHSLLIHSLILIAPKFIHSVLMTMLVIH